jgi:hypothetical protein
VLVAVAGLAGCAATSEAQPSRATPTVEALGRVVDSLAAETAQRLTLDPYRGLAVVVRPGSSLGAEPAVAELLRTRLLERGIPVEVACPAKCLEISMIEFAGDSGGAMTPGQVLTVAAGALPGLGLTRASERQRAAARSTGLLVTFAARDGNRFLARSHAVAILSADTR